MSQSTTEIRIGPLAPGQDVLTVPTMQTKLAAQLHGLGGGFLPEAMARPYIEAGHLVECKTERALPHVALHCAWRAPGTGKPGRALEWWLAQFEREATRTALLEGHRSRS